MDASVERFPVEANGIIERADADEEET